jgi:gluconate 5-dehydrogenase
MCHPLFDLMGKTALITGSSRGLGRAIAEGLAQVVMVRSLILHRSPVN